jgi:hypothetical protein
MRTQYEKSWQNRKQVSSPSPRLSADFSMPASSYFCDLVVRQETFYMSDGRTHSEKMTLPPAPIAGEFSPSEVVAAIRGAQADTIRYPEFVKRSVAAGVIAYWAFLTGKRVIDFGRDGQFHIEEFLRPKP